MPSEIDPGARSDIVYYAALGYTRQEIAEAVDVSRNTVRKYLELTREAVEATDDERETLCAIVENDYDWERGHRSDGDALGYMSM